MPSFHEFEKILNEQTKKIETKPTFDPDKVVLPKKLVKYKEKEQEKPVEFKIKPKKSSNGGKNGGNGGKGGKNVGFGDEDSNKKCECKCFYCSKMKKCEKCTCKNCKCKGCKCNLNKINKNYKVYKVKADNYKNMK